MPRLPGPGTFWLLAALAGALRPVIARNAPRLASPTLFGKNGSSTFLYRHNWQSMLNYLRNAPRGLRAGNYCASVSCRAFPPKNSEER